MSYTMFDRMAMGSHRPLGTVVVPIAELSLVQGISSSLNIASVK